MNEGVDGVKYTVRMRSTINFDDYRGMMTRPSCGSCRDYIYQETERLVAFEDGGYAHEVCAKKRGWIE